MGTPAPVVTALSRASTAAVETRARNSSLKGLSVALRFAAAFTWLLYVVMLVDLASVSVEVTNSTRKRSPAVNSGWSLASRGMCGQSAGTDRAMGAGSGVVVAEATFDQGPAPTALVARTR